MKALASPLRVFNRRRRARRLKAMLRREKAKEKEGEGGGQPMTTRRASSSSGGAYSSVDASSAPSDVAAAATALPPAEKEREHEFTKNQEQVFRLLVRSLHVLCYARLAHAGCEALVAAASAATGDAVGAVAAAVGALEVAATAKLFWSASSAFDSVISSSGSDIELLLAGVASAPGSHGLAAMFEKLCHVLELALFLKIAPLAVVGVAGLIVSFAAASGRFLPAELLGSWSVDALREFAAGVGVA